MYVYVFGGREGGREEEEREFFYLDFDHKRTRDKVFNTTPTANLFFLPEYFNVFVSVILLPREPYTMFTLNHSLWGHVTTVCSLDCVFPLVA